MFDRAWRISLTVIGIGLSTWLAACSAPALSDQDRIATRVAEDRAVAATLTAEAPTLAPLPQATLENTPIPVSSDTPLPPPTKTAVPIVRPTATPQQVVPIVPPTPTLVAIVPGFGNANGLSGRITLPGYAGPLDVPVIRDRIVFRLEVFDPAFGTADGAGITSVDFTISDPSGTQRYSSTIDRPPYCAFAGDQSCDAYVFAERASAWPDGTPICAGSGYQAGMIAHTTSPDRDGAFWGFNFSVAGSLAPCQ